MGLPKNKKLSLGWLRSDIGYNLVYIKAYKKNIVATIIKYPNSPVYTYMIRNSLGSILARGREFTTISASKVCDKVYLDIMKKL